MDTLQQISEVFATLIVGRFWGDVRQIHVCTKHEHTTILPKDTQTRSIWYSHTGISSVIISYAFASSSGVYAELHCPTDFGQWAHGSLWWQWMEPQTYCYSSRTTRSQWPTSKDRSFIWSWWPLLRPGLSSGHWWWFSEKSESNFSLLSFIDSETYTSSCE